MCKETEVKVTEEIAEAVEAAPETVEAAAEAAPQETMADLGEALEESIEKGPVTDDPVWDKFEQQMQEKTIFPVKVESAVKAGVVAFVDDVRGFIPASKLSTGYVENLEEFAGKTLDVVIITADRAAKRLVLSAREALRAKEREAKAAALASVQEGDVMKGTVDSLMDYGAFIELENGCSGLLHVSQISFKRVEKPADVLKKGQEVEVKVIAIKDGKLSLSMKALQEGPARSERAPRGDRPERSDRPRRERRDEEVFNYKETGKATTSLGDLLKGVKLD